jgi:hypothetical protein
MSQPPASPPEPEPRHYGPPSPGPEPYYPPPPAEPYYPPPPGQAWPPPPEPAEPSKTISILALVFGGAALLLSIIPVFGIFLGGLFGIAAIVLGIIGIFISHRLFAIIGIALAVVGLIVAIIVNIAAGRTVEKIVDEWPSNFDDLTSEGPGAEDDQDGEGPQEDEALEGTDPNAPLPAGTEVVTGNWRVAFSNVVPDAAEALAAEDEYNEPPADGHQYFMFQVDATYEGEDSAFAWDQLMLGVSFNNTVYTEYCGIIPDDFWTTPEVFAGGTATGNFCVTVPSEGVEDAVISVQDYWSPGQRYFVDTA